MNLSGKGQRGDLRLSLILEIEQLLGTSSWVSDVQLHFGVIKVLKTNDEQGQKGSEGARYGQAACNHSNLERDQIQAQSQTTFRNPDPIMPCGTGVWEQFLDRSFTALSLISMWHLNTFDSAPPPQALPPLAARCHPISTSSTPSSQLTPSSHHGTVCHPTTSRPFTMLILQNALQGKGY